MSFEEHKLALMQALDRSGWPIREQDIMLLENEIKQGEIYIQQAKDLQEAGKNRGKSLQSDLEKYDDAASVASGASDKQFEVSGMLNLGSYGGSRTKHVEFSEDGDAGDGREEAGSEEEGSEDEGSGNRNSEGSYKEED